MKRLTGYFLNTYENEPRSLADKTRHLFHINALFLFFYSALIPLNLMTGDYLTALLLPLCIAFTLLSLFLIRIRRPALASHVSVFVCFVMISLDLFVSQEAPGHNILYRGGFTFIVFMIVVTLISTDRYMPLKICVISLLILLTVYAVRIYPLQAAVTSMDIAVLINLLMFFAVAAVMVMMIQKDSDRLIVELEREKSAVENHSRTLEREILERTSDLQLAMNRLRDSEERYRSVVENSHDAIVIIDDNFRILFANRELYRITGFGRGDSADQSFMNFIAAESREEVAGRYAKRLRGEQVSPVYELTIISKSGTHIRCEARVSPAGDHGGRKRFAVMLQDVTERKRSEQSLKIQHDLAMTLASAETQQDALNRIMDAVLEIEEVDSGGIYMMDAASGTMDLAVNRGLSEKFVSAGSHLGHDTPQMKVFLQGLPHYMKYTEIVEELEPGEAAKRIPEKLRALAVIPIRHRDTLVAALNCASHTVDDFTAMSRALIESIAAQVGAVLSRLKAEEAVRESERKYRQLVEKGNNIIFTIDVNGVITYISSSIKDLVEFTAAEMTGRPFADFIYKEDLPYIITKFQELEKGILSPDEYRIYTKGGGFRWIISNSQPLFEEGRFQGIIGVFTDITWRKRAEEERLSMERRLLHAQKLESLGVLAGGIAHDFNNLLLAIMGNLELAGVYLQKSSPAHTHVEEAGRASQRAADLVRQMLAYSGSGSFIAREINLSDMVDEIAHLLKASVSRQASLNMQLRRPLHSIIADPAQVQQIVMNLIVNSSEAIGDRQGVIRITTGEVRCDDDYLKASYLEEKPSPGNYVFLEVEDTGCGMDDVTVNKLFDPFFTTKFAGRGLGMAAVLGIVRSHNGAIIVRSRPGEGTSIRILFPTTGQAAAEADDQHEEENAVAPMAGTVLFVDDDDMIRSAASSMLSHLGFSVITAADGARAVDIFSVSHGTIDISIVDFTMPGMNGSEVISHMRAIQPGARAILTSGFHRDDVMNSSRESLADGFIQKPYKMSALEEEIRRVFEIKK